MQLQAISDRRVLSIDGVFLPGLLTISETGIDEAPIEVPESGYIRLIASSNKKIMQIDLMYLCKRDEVVDKFIRDWEAAGKFARDVVVYHTDKSGDIVNYRMRQIFGQCELGSIKRPAFDEASTQKATITISLYPYTYDEEIR